MRGPPAGPGRVVSPIQKGRERSGGPAGGSGGIGRPTQRWDWEAHAVGRERSGGPPGSRWGLKAHLEVWAGSQAHPEVWKAQPEVRKG